MVISHQCCLQFHINDEKHPAWLSLVTDITSWVWLILPSNIEDHQANMYFLGNGFGSAGLSVWSFIIIEATQAPRVTGKLLFFPLLRTAKKRPKKEAC